MGMISLIINMGSALFLQDVYALVRIICLRRLFQNAQNGEFWAFSTDAPALSLRHNFKGQKSIAIYHKTAYRKRDPKGSLFEK